MTIEFRVAENKDFTESLTKMNMQPYYENFSIDWDSAQFDKEWLIFENFEISYNNTVVGIVLVWFDKEACYLRDLQRSPLHQRQGIGSAAITKGIQIAKTKNYKKLRLRIFNTNPAIELYKKYGFVIIQDSKNLFGMELVIN